MNKTIEVEQKYHVDDAVALQKRLIDLGAHEQPAQQHADTYYNHPSRDFAETHEALRVRRCCGVPLITYKGTKLPGAVKARREMEWRLDPGDPDGSSTEELFVQLGFRKVATVRKSRRSFILSHEAREFTITLDLVDSLGCFAEIELVIKNTENTPDQSTPDSGSVAIEAARKQIVNLAPKLGLHRDEPRSYLRMLLESSKTESNL
jgi:adenylate cyclase class 2